MHCKQFVILTGTCGHSKFQESARTRKEILGAEGVIHNRTPTPYTQRFEDEAISVHRTGSNSLLCSPATRSGIWEPAADDDRRVSTTRLVTARRSSSTYATGCSASSSLADCPAEPRAWHQAQPDRPVTALGRGALFLPLLRLATLIQVNGPRAPAARTGIHAPLATMTGWPVMTARPRRCCGWPLCPFWTGQALGDARMGVPCRSRRYPGCRRGWALGRWPSVAGPGGVGRRCWLRAGGVGPWHGSADAGRGARDNRGAGRDGRAAKGLFAQA
jgi:hypothetical protein